MPVAIFLSHSTRDDATVAALRTALESHGVSVWADLQRISPGEELTPRIQEAIASAQHFVVLLTLGPRIPSRDGAKIPDVGGDHGHGHGRLKADCGATFSPLCLIMAPA